MGYCFWRLLHDLLATESGCSGNDGVGKLFWGIKKFSFCCFLLASKFFSHFIGECKNAVCFKMKSREDTKLKGCN